MIPLLAAVAPSLWPKSDPPRFAIVPNILRPDSTLTILALNEPANQAKPLDVEFDGLLFARSGQVADKADSVRWAFALDRLRDGPDSLLQDGPHRVRVRFTGGKRFDSLNVHFHTRAPIAQAQIAAPNDPDERVLSGRVASQLQSQADTVRVEIAFHHEGVPQKVSLPVRKIVEQETGRIYFEFSTTIKGLPKIAPDDPRFGADFFAFRVVDQAGNQYRTIESYAQFVAPGTKQFGVNNLADIELVKHGELGGDQQRLTFVLEPNPPPFVPPLGEPLIKLVVIQVAQDIHELSWNRLPDSLAVPEPLTLVFANNRQIGGSFDTTYAHSRAAPGDSSIYRVEQTGQDGLTSMSLPKG